jgi:hypothetical protein
LKAQGVCILLSSTEEKNRSTEEKIEGRVVQKKNQKGGRSTEEKLEGRKIIVLSPGERENSENK